MDKSEMGDLTTTQNMTLGSTAEQDPLRIKYLSP